MSKYTPSSKKSTIHPSSSLLEQCHIITWSICEGFSIWNISELVLVFILQIYLQTHYSIFCQILISFCAWWKIFFAWLFLSIFFIDEFEKCIHWSVLNSLPSEQAIGSWQHRVKSEETFTSFIWWMTEFIFKILGGPYKQFCATLVGLIQVYFNLSTATSTIVIYGHILI